MNRQIKEIRAEQEMHSCGDPDDVSYCQVRLMDAGAGEYLVIDATEWAFADGEEIQEFADWLKGLLPENEENLKKPLPTENP